ncbi:hypothetical protein C8J56DRAFT_1029847 [Mycena floridula]|nr:hypothetical protein C8J56DRAFT_1029847 [Mycena floridula]
MSVALLLRQATRGSVKALEDLASLGMSDTSIQNQALPVAARNLRKSPPLAQEIITPETIRNILPDFSLIVASLSIFAGGTPDNDPHNDELNAAFSTDWESIHVWMLFLVSRVIETEFYFKISQPESHSALYETLVRVITRFITLESDQKPALADGATKNELFLKPPGLVALITRLTIHGTRLDLDVTQMLDIAAVSMTQHFAPVPVEFSTVMLDVDDSADVILDAIVQTTKYRQVRPQLIPCLFLGFATMVGFPDSSDISLNALRHKFYSHDGIGIFISFISRCNSTTMATLSSSQKYIIFEISLRFLHGLVEIGEIMGKVDALRAGITKVMPKIIQTLWIGSVETDRPSNLAIEFAERILVSISSYLVYPAVLREMRRWCHSLDVPMPDWPPWSTFLEKVIDRLGDRSMFKLSINAQKYL